MSSLRGIRALAVEDEAMLSLSLEAMLLDKGCVIAGTAAGLGDVEWLVAIPYMAGALDAEASGTAATTTPIISRSILSGRSALATDASVQPGASPWSSGRCVRGAFSLLAW